MNGNYGTEYGITTPQPHASDPPRKRSRYLVLIESTGIAVARLYTETREQVAEFDASSEEVAVMIRGLKPENCAHQPDWDQALASYSSEERAAAAVYTLDL